MKKLVIALILLALCFSTAAAEDENVLGRPFPDFSVTDTEGNTFTLSEALKDHEAVLINIWATWCQPCEVEMPFLNEAYAQYGDRVAFIALSCEADDTLELIEAYRRDHGIAFPMGRDENSALDQYLGGGGIPKTVIVDRFGNAAFLRVGSFMSAGEVTRAIAFFLGSDYVETVPLTKIPQDASTCAYPASAATAVIVENENARPVTFYLGEETEPVTAWVIYDDTARLRLEAAASDNPASLICYDYGLFAFFDLPDLFDPQRGAFVYEAPMPGEEAEIRVSYVCLVESGLEDAEALAGIYLIAGDEVIDDMADMISAAGHTVTWEYAEPEDAEEAAPPDAYILYIVDQNGAPVPGMIVNFCTDTACIPQKADDEGVIAFNGEPDVYHVQLLKAPEGYSFDADFEMFAGPAYGEWAVRIRKD